MFHFAGIVVIALTELLQPQSFEVGAIIRRIDIDGMVAKVFANGQERTVAISEDVTIQDSDGKELTDGLGADELKEGKIVTLRVARRDNSPMIISIRAGGKVGGLSGNNPQGKLSVGKPGVGVKPLTEMTADDEYKGEDGGLYGGGQNELPEALDTAAKIVTANIQPLNHAGQPANDGKIGLVSISMSNATQEFSRFKQIADADSEKSRSVTIVDCAQGGQTMARWADPSAPCWAEAKRRLESSNISLEQVQVAWVKLANAGPSGELAQHGRELERDTRSVLANLVQTFPNVRIAYLGSRIYGGYADGRLNPEPYAYEGAFVVRWLIRSQMDGDPDLNFDADRGRIKSPLLLWGPYFWADGMTPRKNDGLIWERSDFAADGTHPSDRGRQKVADQILRFFKSDAHAKKWFMEDQGA